MKRDLLQFRGLEIGPGRGAFIATRTRRKNISHVEMGNVRHNNQKSELWPLTGKLLIQVQSWVRRPHDGSLFFRAVC